MMSTARRISIVVTTFLVALAALFVNPASAGVQAAQSAQATCTGAGECWFTWNPIRAGDCTMTNAKWTLYRNGTAKFEATIHSSDSNDAWLMWPTLLDDNNFVLGPITQGNGDPKFVRGTVKNQWHWWFADGFFDARFFDRIHTMSLRSHC